MFERFFRKKPAAPIVPRLYPNIEDPAFPLFMNAGELARIKKLPIIMILPFTSDMTNRDAALFGAGLSRLLIRNLMLVRNLSVTGPEDTPNHSMDELKKVPSIFQKKICIGGGVKFDQAGITVRLEIIAPSGKTVSKSVSASNGPGVLAQCSETIATIVRGEVNESIRQMWRYGQPASDCEANLIRLGLIRMGFERDDPQQTIHAIELMKQVPTMGSTCSYIDREVAKDAFPVFLNAFEQDPFDASLCFTLFCAVWKSTGHEPEALQFIRKGLELSPGHGKLHMCAPHSVHPAVKPQMLGHSELGYRLLPGNSFAINNYINNLNGTGRPIEDFLALAEEGMAADPHDPGIYQRMLDIFIDDGNHRAALVMAQQLDSLYNPMHERTLYCLKQNPYRASMLESGKWDPAADNRRLIKDLNARLAGK